MSLKIDRVQLDIVINNDQARVQLRKLEDEARLVTKEMKGLDTTTKEYSDKSVRLLSIKTQMDNIYESIGITNMTMRELSKRSQELTLIRQHLRPGTVEFQNIDNEIKQVNARMGELKGKSAITGESIKTSFSGMQMAYAKVLGGIAILTGAAASLVKFFDAYREQERAVQKVEQAIKSTSNAAGLGLKQLTDEASRLQNETLFGDEDILNKSTAQLLTFTNIVGDTFLRAQKGAMDLSTVLDGDLQNASIMLGKALNDPISGLTALKRVGVAFTEQQKEQIKVLTETNQLEKAQAIILGEVERQYGGQALAAAKGAGIWSQVKIQLGEVSEAIGGKLAKATSAFAAQWRDTFKSIAEDLSSAGISQEFEKQVSAVANLTTKIDPLLSRYDELKSKSKLSKDEQSELNTIIKQVSETIPGAVSAFDDYGVAIGINTSKAREFINEQVAMMGVMNQEAIKETEKALKKLTIPVTDAKRLLDNIMKSGNVTVQAGINVYDRKASQDEIKAAQDKYAALKQEQLGYQTYLKKLNGDALKDEIEMREKDSKSAKELEEKKVVYKKMTLTKLKELADSEDGLAVNELERRRNAKEIKSEISDSIKELDKQISDIDTKINNAIASGNLPLAEKFQKEKESLELLAETYKAVKAEIAKGWDINQRDQGSIDTLVGIGSKIVTTGKPGKSPLQKRDNKIETGPSSDVVANEEAEKKLREDYKTVALESAKITNDAIFSIVANRQQAEYDNQINLLEKQRQKELSNKNLTEAEKEAINAKYDAKAKKLKQDAFKKQKAADIIQAVINTALAIASANRVMPPGNIPAMLLAGIAGAAQIAVIAAQKVPQYYTGRNIDVTGSLDGRQYKNVPYSGTATTGLYTHPTLIADHGSEIVIDHLRSRNIQMNYPEILQAIRAVPQHYAGRIPDQATSDIQQPTSDISNSALLAVMNEHLVMLRKLQQEGVQLNYQKLKDMQAKESKAEKLTAM